MHVAFAAVSAFHDEVLLSLVINIADDFARLSVFGYRPERNAYIDILAVFAVAIVGFALAAVFRDEFSFIHKIDKTAFVAVAHKIYASAFAAVSAVGSAVGNSFIPQK